MQIEEVFDSASSGSEEEDEELVDDSRPQKTKAGFASAISKILKTKVKKKAFILSEAKSKQLDDAPVVKQQPTIEVVAEDGRVKDLATTGNESTGDEATRKKSAREVHREQSHKEWENIARLKPSPLNKEQESFLSSIATKGVVQLFNAVTQQKMKINEKLNEAGKLEFQKDKALASFSKQDFIDTLNEEDERLGKKRKPEKKESEKGWKVLKDDFMGDAKMKDWDNKEDESDE
ncbi:RRP15-like protein [Halotydeus destructor]|nr:RRP15-like protein [Halotydeus destructor]